MSRFDIKSKEILENSLDYEIWLLNYLLKEDTFYGNLLSDETSLDTKYFMDEWPNFFGDVLLQTETEDRCKKEFMEKMSPFIFIACYKILDIIYEWILKENLNFPPELSESYEAEIKNFFSNKEIPFEFEKKIELIKTLDREDLIIYPDLLLNQDIRVYLFNLYKNLRNFRNEIIHKHSLKVMGGNLEIKTENKNILIDKEQMKHFATVIITSINILSGKLGFGKKEELLYRYQFDQIQSLHESPLFNQREPLKINVKWILEPSGVGFKANLKHLRDLLKEAYKNYDVMFNLFIFGIKVEEFLYWNFDADEVPKEDSIVLKEENAAIILYDELESHISEDKLKSFGIYAH